MKHKKEKSSFTGMCHPKNPPPPFSYTPATSHRLISPERSTSEQPVSEAQRRTNRCICSPTYHPRSFRCQWHHRQHYNWGNAMPRTSQADCSWLPYRYEYELVILVFSYFFSCTLYHCTAVKRVIFLVFAVEEKNERITGIN